MNAPEAGTITKHLAEEEATVEVGADLFVMEPGEGSGGGAKKQQQPPEESKKEEAPKDEEVKEESSQEPEKKDVAPKEESKPAPAPPTSSPPKQEQQEVKHSPQQPKKESKGAQPAEKPPVFGSREERRVKMNRMRLRIAERLKESQNTAASLTTFNEVDMSSIMEFRSKYKDEVMKKTGVKLGFMSAFAKASIIALKEVPAVNASIEGQEIVYRDYIDLSVAVATTKGLLTPIVRNIETLDFVAIEKAIADLGAKARDNKITLEDLTGGTFTISNGGVFGSLMGTPIINLPQTAVLGLHAIKDKPVVVNGQIVIRPMMYLALTYGIVKTILISYTNLVDHRLVDGREAVTFLKTIKELVEDPRKMLLS